MDIDKIIEHENQVKCLVIKDFSNNYIRYDLVHSSIAQELLNFINKLPMESFFQNFKLVIEKTGKRIYNDDNLYLLDLQDYDIIKMIPNLYDPISAKEHYEKVNYMLNEHPFFVGAELTHLKDIVFQDYDKLVETSKDIYSNLNGVTPFPFYNYLMEDQEFETEEEEENENKEEKKDDKESLDKAVEKEKAKQKKKKDKLAKRINALKNKKLSLEDIKQEILGMDYKRLNLSDIPNSYIYEKKDQAVKYRCITEMYLSAFNSKIETKEAPKGDLIYIEVVTNENKHYFITGCEKGFFINSSKEHSYSPLPSSKLFSYTLPGLLSQISPGFKDNFSKTLSQNIQGDDFLYLPSPQDKFDWLVSFNNPFSYDYRYKSFVNEKDLVLMLNKEWNEEYQGIIDIKQMEELNLETKEKLLVPFYNNFKSIALKGAKLISEKKLNPFSMVESPAAGYYIYGNIFITVLENSSDFTIFNKATQSQTIYGANLDLRHINYLNKIRYQLDLNNIYLGLCCIINYKGLVLHAQVMTPGIIFNSEHLIVYGEYDDGKIRKEDNFQNEIKPIYDKLGIVSNDITDAEGKVEFTDYLGHPEIKGVKGVDKRNYLFDLVHLFPRDLNFDDHGFLIRPELVHEYRSKLINDALNTPEFKEKSQKIQDEMDAISKTAKDQKEMMTLLEKPYQEREALYTELEKNANESFKLNTVYKTEFNSNNAKDEDIKTLENMSVFLKEELITKFLTECQKESENLPCDSESLKSYIHKFGISSRYLGLIVKKIEADPSLNKSLCWLKSLIQREIINKCARSVFNENIKNLAYSYVEAFTAYFLNVLLGHPNQIKALDYFTLTLDEERKFKFSKPEADGDNKQTKQTNQNSKNTNTNTNHKSKDDKNKKKKKKNKGKAEINLDIKFFLNENLVGNNVTGFIDFDEQSLFIKPSQVRLLT